VHALEQPRDEILWLTAVDPAQPWGKCLPHLQNRAFLNVTGTAVALHAGVPAAVFERQGKLLRVFDSALLPEALKAFVSDYTAKRLFPALNRITVKQYPSDACDALIGAGFIRELQDYVLYRGYK
jgi:ATP-dependent Lhr-like helicase